MQHGVSEAVKHKSSFMVDSSQQTDLGLVVRYVLGLGIDSADVVDELDEEDDE